MMVKFMLCVFATIKNYLTQNVHSAKVEKPSPKLALICIISFNSHNPIQFNAHFPEGQTEVQVGHRVTAQCCLPPRPVLLIPCSLLSVLGSSWLSLHRASQAGCTEGPLGCDGSDGRMGVGGGVGGGPGGPLGNWHFLLGNRHFLSCRAGAVGSCATTAPSEPHGRAGP